MAEELCTTAEVVDALGGVQEVARITGRKYGAAWNWLKFQTFPSDTFLVLTAALRAKGKSAPASLWGMVESSPAPQQEQAGAA
jgi:hypothetical protein